MQSKSASPSAAASRAQWATEAALKRRVSALEVERTARRATIDWQFTALQVRVTLKKHYPVVKDRTD